jgi:hypothetical protein
MNDEFEEEDLNVPLVNQDVMKRGKIDTRTTITSQEKWKNLPKQEFPASEQWELED